MPEQDRRGRSRSERGVGERTRGQRRRGARQGGRGGGRFQARSGGWSNEEQDLQREMAVRRFQLRATVYLRAYQAQLDEDRRMVRQALESLSKFSGGLPTVPYETRGLYGPRRVARDEDDESGDEADEADEAADEDDRELSRVVEEDVDEEESRVSEPRTRSTDRPRASGRQASNQRPGERSTRGRPRAGGSVAARGSEAAGQRRMQLLQEILTRSVRTRDGRPFAPHIRLVNRQLADAGEPPTDYTELNRAFLLWRRAQAR
jgi:hypothetical protein